MKKKALFDSRKAVEFHLHIEHFERRIGDVWAVSIWEGGRKTAYLLARGVICEVPVMTGRNDILQPWAYLSGVGRVVELPGKVLRIT